MGLHDVELVVRQAAGLVQDAQRNGRLAHVVHQPAQARLAGQDAVQPQLAGQRQHQRADRHRMQIGVVVARLEPRHAEQGLRMAADRIGDLAHQRQGGLRVDGAAHPGFLEHPHDLILRGQAQAAGLVDLFFQGHRRRRGLHGGETVAVALLRLRVAAGIGLRRGRVRRAAALVRIDPDALDASGLDGLQILLPAQQEAAAPEGMAEPVSLEPVDIHSKPQLGQGNTLDRHVSHPQIPGDRCAIGAGHHHSSACNK